MTWPTRSWPLLRPPVLPGWSALSCPTCSHGMCHRRALPRCCGTYRVPARRSGSLALAWVMESSVADGKTFLAKWGEQAQALGWTAKDLFGLVRVPDNAKPSFNRLSRYDETGLIWLLDGRRVVALTEGTAAIQNPATASITMYRRFDKPALG